MRDEYNLTLVVALSLLALRLAPEDMPPPIVLARYEGIKTPFREGDA